MPLSTRPTSHSQWASFKVERCAAIAYLEARCPIVDDLDLMPGPGELLVRLYGPCATELVEHGARVGRAVVECDPVGGGRRPARVRILRAQPLEQLMVAMAHACAYYVAWRLDETWSDAMLHAVALHIIMPRAVFEPMMDDEVPLDAIAEAFHVDHVAVLERIRLRAGLNESGERPASGAG